jgi:RNA polymerase sigma factor FliA
MPKTKVQRAKHCKRKRIREEERERLLIEHLPLVRYVAKAIHERLPQHVPIDDLIQAGMIGLIQAVDNFDSTRKVPLRSYAKLRIRGAILDNLRDLDWSPRSLRAMARRIEATVSNLAETLRRIPDDEEVCEAMGMTLGEYQQVLGNIKGLEIARLSIGHDEEEGESPLEQEVPDFKTEDPLSAYLGSERRQVLADAMSQLSDRERQILSLYYFNELTMKQVGEMLGVGESRVSQIHTATLDALRFWLKPSAGTLARTNLSFS